MNKLHGHELGFVAFDLYEKAIGASLLRAKREARVAYYGFDIGLDEDWFLIRGHWGPVFDSIEELFERFVREFKAVNPNQTRSERMQILTSKRRSSQLGFEGSHETNFSN